MSSHLQEADPAAERRRRIYAVVTAIPPGVVASYGQVAAQAGLPRGARQVGRALAQCPPGLPWHRVVNAAGRISLPAGSPAFREQVARLRAEGVEVRGGRVSRRLLDAHAGLDALLWGFAPDAKGEADVQDAAVGGSGAGRVRRGAGTGGRRRSGRHGADLP
ncbi:MAG: MGMT family protein [Gammaproteobacteria bacterium]|nr:MGMT family protein [Gammaproteobacteria bacterium]